MTYDRKELSSNNLYKIYRRIFVEMLGIADDAYSQQYARRPS